MSELRWGIVGCGDVVEKKSGPSIMAGNRSHIIAVMRRDRAKLDAFADKHDIPLRTTNPADIYHCPAVDIVYVATPPHLHREQVIAAAEAGRHVLVEKPMGMTAAESQDMIEACERAGVELFVAYYRRFQPHIMKMRQLINEGMLGQLIHGQVEFAMPYRPGHDWGWRTSPAISGGGLFTDLLSHRIDLLISFFGKPCRIQGVRKAFHPDTISEDLASVILQFESGAQCTVIGNFAGSKSVDRFVLTGTTGEIHTDHLDGHKFELTRHRETEKFVIEPFPAPHMGLIRHIEQVLAGETANASSGSDGQLTDSVLDVGVRRST